MAARAFLLSAWLLAGCLSAPEGDEGGAGGDCEAIAFSDDFEDDGWLTAHWQNSDQDADDMLRSDPGRAVIALTGVTDEYAWYETGATFDFTDRCVSVEVPEVINHGEDVDAEAMMGVSIDDTTWIGVGVSGGSLCCQLEVDGDAVEELCDLPFSPAEHARWHLRFEDGEVACETAGVGEAWAEYFRFAYGGPLVGTLRLMAGTWAPVADPGQVAFDNLSK
jgi:hypothetical protein